MMYHSRVRWLNPFRCGVLLLLPLLLATEVFSQQSSQAVGLNTQSLRFQSKYLLQKDANRMLSLEGYRPGERPWVTYVRQEVLWDSVAAYIMVRETIHDYDITPPLVFSFQEYTETLMEQELRAAWREYFVTAITEGVGSIAGTGGINLEIPVKIKSKTFQQIFGSGTVGLQVTGDISIKASLRRQNLSEVRDALTRGSNTQFNMEQKQRFQVTGKIGDKVTVNVDQDSERAFDFDNNVRIHYQGYEDEIIQKIEAGNISLSLPGTRYVTFSGQNSGLFGIKSEMVLGNLNVTAIASQEKGDSQRLSLSGGASEGKRRVEDYSYVANTYFFLDPVYRENYKRYGADNNHIAISPDLAIIPETIEVYKAGPNYDIDFPDKSFAAWAVFDWQDDPVATDIDTVETGEAEFGNFIRLERSEYIFEPSLGYIRMNNAVANDEILAVTFEQQNGRVFDVTVGAEQERVLKLIKGRNTLPSHATSILEWKHVYSMGSRNVEFEGLEVKMFFKKSSGPDEEADEVSGNNWVTVFGIDNKGLRGGPPDGEIDLDNTIINRGFGEIHFPDLRPFDPEGYFVAGELISQVPGDKRTPAIYDTTSTSFINAESKFYLDIKTTSRGTEFDLGFNVIENSEQVTLNGQQLVKGVDYTIDYFSGSLKILNEQASSPSAQLDVTYERNQLFQLEKKTIFGMRAEYGLGRDSFIGGTLLYLNETTLDRKVRVGRGPMRNLVWDLNTRLKFTPNFIGNAFDALPFIRAKGETSLNFEGEIAQVLPTPNTLNSGATGDNNGVAYIDDFEGAKRTTSLGVIRKNWTQSSVPENQSSLWNLDNMGNLVWYNPFNQVFIQDIYPEQEVNSQVSQRQHVLTFELLPDSARTQVNRWGGVMRGLSPGFFDQSETKFIEIMVQGDKGRLHIDLGLVSEDVIRNGRLNDENVIIRNNALDEGEDTGIDGIAKPDPPTFNYPRSNHVGKSIEECPFDFWDINNNGVKDANEPWSFDDWLYTESSPFTYFREFDNGSANSINGTDGNENDQGGRVPDTEDINKNSILDPIERYFSYSVSLEADPSSADPRRANHPDAELIVGGNFEPPPGGPWKLYRIPFTDAITRNSKLFGSPQKNQIEFVRIWVDSVDQYADQTVRFSIADLSLVGNEWKELGITTDDSNLNTGFEESDDFAVSVINTFDNPDVYVQPEGVEGEEDRITGIRAREQSLVFKATSLDTGEAGIAQKSFFQPEDYIHYKRIKMFVYGSDVLGQHIPADQITESKVEYFFRFGSDVNNYYEYRSRVYAGWDERNHMDVLLQDFTTLARPQEDTTNTTGRVVQYLDPQQTKSIAIVGNPSLRNVRILIMGVKNIETGVSAPFQGEVWFNELRLSDVEKEKGVAMRVRTDLAIADFATINGELEKKDADFHNVATRFGTGDNSTSGNVNATINVDKVLPQSFGLALPLTLNYRESSSNPKYVPGTDRLVNDDITQDELALVQTITKQSGFNFSFRRQAKSDNFFLKNTLDNIDFSIGRSENDLLSPTFAVSNTRTWNGNVNYKLDFGRNNFISLFSWMPNLPLLGKIKETRFYYTPQNISFRVDGAKTNTKKLSRTTNAPLNTTEIFDVNRSVRTSMKVFENLSFDFSRAHKADMKDATAADFFKFNFDDYNISQNFSARYRPEVFDWLTHNFNYSSNYTFNDNLQQQNLGKSARVTTNKAGDFVFKWKQFAADIFGVGKSKSSGSKGRRPPGRPAPEDEPPPNDGAQRMQIFQEGKERSGIKINPLKIFGTILTGFKDISFNVSQRKNITQNALTEGLPSYAFQFGLSDETGVATDSTYASVPVILGNTNSYTVGSGIAIGRAMDVTLRFEHSASRNEAQQGITGTTTNSWLRLGGFDMPFPEWTVKIGGIEALPFFGSIFRSVSFNHNFTGRREEGWNTDPNNRTQESFTTNFRPLGKIDINFKNGLSGSVQLNRSRTLTRTFTGTTLGLNRTTNSDISVTANFSKRSGFKIPIWPFNKAELKNSIDFSFTFSASNTLNETSRGAAATGGGEAALEEFDKTTRWNLSPRLTYSFSNQVRGGAFLEIGSTTSKRNGTTSFQEFGIDINIAIRGR